MNEKKWARTIADDGYGLCPDCHGRSWCKWCRSTGRLLADTSKHCGSCAGKGECLVCDGTGQLPEEHYALTDWKDDEKIERERRVPGDRRVLLRIGNFQELGYDDDPSAPTLADARGKRSPANKAEVVRYLNSGKTFILSPGIDQDVFDDRKRADTSTILTDGTFLWQKQVAYYVEQYDIELPAEFEAHMRANRWQVPDHVDITMLQAPG